ncbi:MAG: HAD family phosphatase [Eubacterium sp.]|nr:HAD family phosphatase [Eubacterium sp.]
MPGAVFSGGIELKYKAVIFDMDGVIFDSERLYIECNKEAARKFGITDMDMVEDLGKSCIGITLEETLRKMRACLGEDFPLDEMWAETAGLFKEKTMGGNLPVKEGVVEILEYLKDKKVPIAIASSTKSDTVKRELSEAGLLDYFDKVVGGDMIKNSKPAPDSFLKAAEVLGVDPKECCIIEDSFNGIRAAHAAGGFPIMVPDILQPDDEIRGLAGEIFGSLLDVRDYLAQD